MTMEFFPIIRGMATATDTAIRPPAKAPISIPVWEMPKRMASEAPTQEPEETPSMSGATKGFLKTLW